MKIEDKELKELKRKLKGLGKKFKSKEAENNLRKQRRKFDKLKRDIDGLNEPTHRNLVSYRKKLIELDKAFMELYKPKSEKKDRNLKLWTYGIFLSFSLIILTFFYFVLKGSIPVLMNIFNKFLGAQQFSIIVLWGILWFVVILSIIELFALAGIIDGKHRFSWVSATILLMLAFFVVSIFYVEVSIGQGDLNLVLRNSSDIKQVIGSIDCTGGSKSFLLVEETIVCKITPELEEERATVQFIYLNKTKSPQILLEDHSFNAPNNLTYIYFEVNGKKDTGQYSANVGYPYSFLTEDEALEKKKEFIKYLGAIFAIIFITIPLMMGKFKELAKND